MQAAALNHGSRVLNRLFVNRLCAIAVSVMAVLFVVSSFITFTGSAKAQTKPASPDASITKRVESALHSDRGLRTMQIHVETQDGVVNLSGFVRSLDDIDKAGEIARGVSGVSAVRNGLRVANRPSRA